jgi:predicted Zn-dependent peptidase
VKAAASPMLGAYLDRHYRGPGMVIAAAGAVQHDQLVELAGSSLGTLAGEAGPSPVGATYRGGEVREERDLMESQIMLGFQGVPYAHEDFYTAQVLSSIIGGGMSSRLFQEVREKRGLCYSIYAFHWSFSDTGVFGVHAATGPEDVRRLMPVVVDELERAAEGISDKEVLRARAQLRAGLLMTLESPRPGPASLPANCCSSAASSRPTNSWRASRPSTPNRSAPSPHGSSAALRRWRASAPSPA